MTSEEWAVVASITTVPVRVASGEMRGSRPIGVVPMELQRVVAACRSRVAAALRPACNGVSASARASARPSPIICAPAMIELLSIIRVVGRCRQVDQDQGNREREDELDQGEGGNAGEVVLHRAHETRIRLMLSSSGEGASSGPNDHQDSVFEAQGKTKRTGSRSYWLPRWGS